MRKAAISIIQTNKAPASKVVEFNQDMAIRLIRRAYPEARITIAREDRYEGDKSETCYRITVDAPSYRLTGASRISIRDAFRDLVQSGKLKW